MPFKDYRTQYGTGDIRMSKHGYHGLAMTFRLPNGARDRTEITVRVADGPRTAIADGLNSGIPCLHFGYVERPSGRDDQIDLRGPRALREEQVPKHHCVGKLQQERQVDGALAEIAAHALRERQLVQGRSQHSERESEEVAHDDRVAALGTFGCRPEEERRLVCHALQLVPACNVFAAWLAIFRLEPRRCGT